MKFKNSLIIFFVKLFFNPKKGTKKNYADIGHHFLIVSTTALGDSLWATPAIRSLKTTYPLSQLSVFTSQTGFSVLKENPHIDHFFVLKKPYLLTLLQIYLQAKNKTIDTVFIFHTSQRMILPFCSMLQPKEIIGNEGMHKGLDTLLTKKIPVSFEHEIERRLGLVQSVGSKVNNYNLEIFISNPCHEEAKIILQKKKIPNSKMLIAMHPGSKDRFKRWPESCFITLGKLLKEKLDCQILITAGPSEQTIAKNIADHIPDAIFIDENIQIQSFAALIQKFHLFITNDTGPMHLGFAVKTPTVALFTPTDAKLCGPKDVNGAAIIQKEKTCTPCLRKKCLEPFCMLQISPNEVLEKALNLLRTKDL
jgi:ADP-heptose:LPS heptosyltransferase